jgi:glyoxylase-like metal-dependent hydrolase (beta-lactamase superfamily II)
VTFHLNGEELHAFHVAPAHTDGDSVVHFRKSNVIHMGDLFFNGAYPFIDVSSGGSIEGIIAAADRVIGMADTGTKIIPGHGAVAAKDDLVRYRDMLKGVLGAVKPLVSAGKTLDEIKAAKPTAAYDETWGKAFVKPDLLLQILYQDLGRKR